MSFDGVRAAIYDTLIDELATKAPGVPVGTENNKFNQPSGPWIYLALVPGDSRRAELSTSRNFFHYGVINVQVMVPQDTGTKRLHDLTQAVVEILADRNWTLAGGGRLTTYRCKRKSRGNLNGFATYAVMTEYRHDERLG